MIRYTVLLVGVTVFAIAFIAEIGSLEAEQVSATEPVMWADTTHIKLAEGDLFEQARLIPIIGRIQVEVLDADGGE